MAKSCGSFHRPCALSLIYLAFASAAAWAAKSPSDLRNPGDPLLDGVRSLPSARPRCEQIRASFEPLLMRPKPDAPATILGDWKLRRALDLITQIPRYPSEGRAMVDAFFAKGDLTRDRFSALHSALNGAVCPAGQELEMWTAAIEGARQPRAPLSLKEKIAKAAKRRIQQAQEAPPTLASVRSHLDLAKLAIDSKLWRSAPAPAVRRLAELREELNETALNAQRELTASFPRSRPTRPEAPEAQTWEEATRGGDFDRAKRALEKEYATAVRLRAELAQAVEPMEPFTDETVRSRRARR